jgi:hypothetical protein
MSFTPAKMDLGVKLLTETLGGNTYLCICLSESAGLQQNCKKRKSKRHHPKQALPRTSVINLSVKQNHSLTTLNMAFLSSTGMDYVPCLRILTVLKHISTTELFVPVLFPRTLSPLFKTDRLEIRLSENGGNKKAIHTDGMSIKGSFREKASTRFSTLEIDDPQWRCPMAYRVALDLPYRTMRLALHRLITIAIDMAREGGAFVCHLRFCCFSTRS